MFHSTYFSKGVISCLILFLSNRTIFATVYLSEHYAHLSDNILTHRFDPLVFICRTLEKPKEQPSRRPSACVCSSSSNVYQPNNTGPKSVFAQLQKAVLYDRSLSLSLGIVWRHQQRSPCNFFNWAWSFPVKIEDCLYSHVLNTQIRALNHPWHELYAVENVPPSSDVLDSKRKDGEQTLPPLSGGQTYVPTTANPHCLCSNVTLLESITLLFSVVPPSVWCPSR